MFGALIASVLIDAARQSGLRGFGFLRPLTIKGGAAAVAFDVHFEDCRVMDEAVDGRQRHGWIREDLAHSPNGWLAVISIERRS